MFKPYLIEVQRDEYFLCQCGESQDQPYCDGSHEGTGIEPIKTELNGKHAICACHQSSNNPFCDGTHSKKIA